MQTPVWHIEMLGQFRLRRGEQVVTRFRTTKAALLLARLALYPRQAHAREELADLFWPDAEPQIGRNRLKQEISTLRRILEPEGEPYGSVLQANRNLIGLREGTVQTDAGEFESLVAQAAAKPGNRLILLAQAANMAGGELLPGFYEDWILRERDRLNLLRADTFRRLAAAQEEAGQIEAAIVTLQQLFALDPAQEATTAHLMRLYIQSGQAGFARRQFARWEQIAREELDSAPSPWIRELAAQANALNRLPNAAPRANEITVDDHNATGNYSAGTTKAQPSTLPLDVPASFGAGFSPVDADADAQTLSFSPCLPLTLTRFFGRETEQNHLRDWLAPPTGLEEAQSEMLPSRLVTITGVAGTGKTRLAIAVAQSLVPEYAGAVAFVALADQTAPERIAESLLTALRLSRTGNNAPMELLVSRLSQAPHLLVFDNFEHLVEGGAEWLADLRTRVPALICLVTSRRKLELEGEHEWLLAPLPIPVESCWLRVEGDNATDSQVSAAISQPHFPQPTTLNPQLTACSSVQLFLDRARIARPDFQLNARNAEAVAAICARLEGLPLALELAAARVNLLSPAQILKQLEQRFAFLVSKRRDISERHRSLSAALQWSYGLLPPNLQTFFCRLSVFRGGFTHEAAQSVCEPANALEMLEQLRAWSLIFVEEIGGETRCRLLETMREWGEEHLSADARAMLRERHADFFAALVELALPQLYRAEQKQWLERLEADWNNIRAAMAWSLDENLQGVAARKIAGSAWYFAQMRGYAAECERWLEHTLRTPLPSALRAPLLFGLGYLAKTASREAQALSWLRQAFAAYEQCGDVNGMAFSACYLGAVSLLPFAERQAWTQQSLALCRASGNRHGEACALLESRSQQKRLADQIRVLEQSCALFRESGDWRHLAIATGELCFLFHRQTRLAEAEAMAVESLALVRDLGEIPVTAHTLWLLSGAVREQGRYAEAEAHLKEALELCRRFGVSSVAHALYTMALGFVYVHQEKWSSARVLYEQAQTEFQLFHNQKGSANAGICLAALCFLEGRDQEAREHLSSSWTVLQEVGEEYWHASIFHWQARIAVRSGDLSAAVNFLKEEVAYRAKGDGPLTQVIGVEASARIAAAMSENHRAARWLAAAQAAREQIGAPLPPIEQAPMNNLLHTLRERLGEPVFAAAWEQGKHLTIAQAFAEAQTYFSF